MSSKIDNVNGVDYMVEEYLLYCGFTQTFRCLDKEKRSKQEFSRAGRYAINISVFD